MLVSERMIMKHKMRTARKTVGSLNKVFVELMTPKRKVFSGHAAAVEFSPANAVVQLEPDAVSYFGLINCGELTLRVGIRFRCFALFRAAASISQRRLTIIAEAIEPIAVPVPNCGNPLCDCGERIFGQPSGTLRSKVLAVSRHRREQRRKSLARLRQGSGAQAEIATRKKKKRKQ